MALFTDKPASFPEGLKVLAIDHDITLLNSIEEMCNRCNYKVTKCSMASDAFNMLERKDCFDVMLIDPHMPNMDAYDFVQSVVLQLNIPVIMMAVDSAESSIMKSIQCGACECWTKPLVEKQFKTMWQHVIRKGLTANKEYEIVGSSVVQEIRKRGREDDNASKETQAKKARLSWSPELHQRFLWAVNQLGLDRAMPKKILKIMDVPNMTKEQVASHLQKYRNYLKSSTEDTKGRMKKLKKSPFETKFSLEATHSLPEQDQSFLLNSATQCRDNCDAQQHWVEIGESNITSNIFSDLPNLFPYVDDDLSSLVW
ncbi:putative response regulator and transcription factor RR-A-type family [Medicago truncatula]|uniref:Putative response regulator and transcription factor RR-A-type family n=1 Tax=Medicago truncatula TaxID=3880 RepID=A0A396I0H3_MEDTR|nr:two-component response regulator ORR26 [Medicago truncatula]RHN59122.1 putative response regulator and transcription factor RR-A-type family [Medicago truncatula]